VVTGPTVVIKVHEVSDPSEDENTTPNEVRGHTPIRPDRLLVSIDYWT